MTLNAYVKWDRLKNALKMRGIDHRAIDIDILADVLEKRGMTDATLNNIVWHLISALEPPGCEMTHCKMYGNSAAPMNCGDGRVPGRCKILRDYRDRKRGRIARDWRRVLNDDDQSVRYDDMPHQDALKTATRVAEIMRRRSSSAATKDRISVALEGARAELSDNSAEASNV